MGLGRQIMKTRLIQIATLLLLTSAAGLASAAEPETTSLPRVETPTVVAQPAEDRDRLAWQRVGAPSTLEG